METNVNYTVVGAFVILLLMLIIYCVIWLSGGFSTEEYSIYKVYMKEPVTGLNLEAPVEYNGVVIGSVCSIEINHKNPRLVELLLKIKNGTPITVGTRAKLGVKFLSGIAYMQLEDKGINMTPLVALNGERYPIINTVPSFLLRVDTAITEMSTSFQQMSESLRTLLDDENLRAIKGTLINLREFTNEIAENKMQLKSIIDNAARASHLLQTQTLPDANVMINNINNAAHNFSQISADFKQNPSMLIRGKSTAPLGPGE